jgi:hypothetical protein
MGQHAVTRDTHTAPLPLGPAPLTPDQRLLQAWRASGLRRLGYVYEDALRDPALAPCIKNLAKALTLREARA